MALNIFKGLPFYDRVAKTFGWKSPELSGLETFLRLPGVDRVGVKPTNFPDGHVVLEGGGRAFSTFSPQTAPERIPVHNEKVMWGHEDFIASSEGLRADGELDHCYGGGCQYRAFSNYTDLQKSVPEITDLYLRNAVGLGHLARQDYNRGNWVKIFTKVPEDLIFQTAEDLGMVATTDAVNSPPSLITSLTKQGVLYATVGQPHGTHLVAIKNGKQVVPHPDQKIADVADMEGFESQMENQWDWTDLEEFAQEEGFASYEDYKASVGSGSHLTDPIVRGLFLPRDLVPESSRMGL